MDVLDPWRVTAVQRNYVMEMNETTTFIKKYLRCVKVSYTNLTNLLTCEYLSVLFYLRWGE